MKKIKIKELNFRIIILIIIWIGILFTNTTVFATEEVLQSLFTEDFINWQNLSEEERENTEIPRLVTTLTSEETLENFSIEYSSFKEQILTRSLSMSVNNGLVGNATYNSTSYNLNSNILVNVKNQGTTNECWAFSITTVLETNLELNRDIQKIFSTRHMNYATARTFTDGENELAWGREAEEGGLSVIGLAYLTNGQGAVLESDMPFESNAEQISLEEIDKEVDTIVTSYKSLPAIYKEYDTETGEITYTNGGVGLNYVVYEKEEVEELRNIIKDHIIKYGAISAVTASNQTNYYNNSNMWEATAYFCNSTSVVRDHAVTIVGWDDNYSKENFTGDVKPSTDGAYITVNSYGTEVLDNGYLYISYEDVLIETDLYGIKSTSDVDYDKLYQYNPYGSNSLLGLEGESDGYIGTVYDRDASNDEYLTYVGISIPDDLALEIYVNPTGNSTVLSNLTKIAETEILEAGYHRIPVTATKLTGNVFSIVVKEISTNNRFYFSVEASVDNSVFENVTGNSGKCFYSLDGYSWADVTNVSIAGLDMAKTDLCIKAFTEVVSDGEENTEPENEATITLSSNTYTIETKDIYKIEYKTKASEFKNNIETNSETLKIYDTDGNEISDSDIIKNGMILKLSDDSEYVLIVRGDLDASGTINLTDLSKLILYYNEDPLVVVTEEGIKAGDLNYDGKVSLTDISQMVLLYNSII